MTIQTTPDETTPAAEAPVTETSAPATHAFEADVARLLHMMVHSVYSDKTVFLRELISNAADACEKLRYEALSAPELLGDETRTQIAITLDPDARTLTIQDNGIGMTADDMGEALGTIAPVDTAEAPARGTRVVLHLLEDATSFTDRYTVERLIKDQSGHVPVPITLREKPDAEPVDIADGAALWTKPKSEISTEDYADFYRSVSGQFDEPALTLHYRAEGLHESSVLAYVPGAKPFDLFDPDRNGRMKLYVKRVFITDDAEVLPRYLRFMRGLVDSTDVPLNVSREMIQESPMLAAIRKGVTGRVLAELDKLATRDAEAYAKVWENFGAVLKEGLYEDFERRDALLKLARFKTTTSGGTWRSITDYVGAMKENQTAIYYAVGTDLDRLEASPQLEGFRARGIEVLLLPDSVDGFWVTAGIDHDGKPFKSVTQGAADLGLIPLVDGAKAPTADATPEVADFITFVKVTLGDAVSEVRASERLTDSAVCLVAADSGMDRQLERILAASGQAMSAAKPVLEINPRSALIAKLAALGADETALREDAAHLLFDEAQIADGERPVDARAFSARLTRLFTRVLG